MTGQVRAISGGVLGWDFGSGFALADAMGISPQAVAEFLPAIEAAAVAAANERIRDEDHDD